MAIIRLRSDPKAKIGGYCRGDQWLTAKKCAKAFTLAKIRDYSSY
jgi:hypothetical protein